MTIQQILEKIQNERYGETVRQAIIDGIRLCYDERALGGYNPVEDLNDFYNGSALFDSNAKNAPSLSSFIVMSAGIDTNCCQVAIDATNLNNSYLRKKQSNSWSAWMLIGTSKKLHYWNYNGSELLYTESVSSGHDGIWNGTPTKDPTQQYEYTFLGWSTGKNASAAEETATKNITADRDVYAAYRQSVRNYTVYFYNGSTLLGNVLVPYDSNASDSTITRPAKESTAQYEYTFVGWNSQDEQETAEANVLTNIRADKNVYAAFSKQIRSYTVSFYIYSGSQLLGTDTVQYGGNASDSGIVVPAKTSTAQYRYVFDGWNSNSGQTAAEEGVLNNITGNKSVYAAYKPVIRTYTVRFMNGTTVLQTVNDVPYGGDATYTGSTPQHPTAPDDYTFIGFDPDGTNIKGATDCNAVYILNPKELRYWNYDGSELLHTELVEVGADGSWNGTSSRASTAEHSYIFLGWNTSKNASVADANATKNVTDDRDVYAAFEETVISYSVRFFNGTTLLYTDHVQYGDTASYTGDTPTKASTPQYTYTFVGWNSQDGQSAAESDILTNIVADKDVYAAFSSTLQQYTVTFMNGATTLGTVTVNYGADASDSSITTPTKEQTPQYTYTFVGWNSQDGQSAAESDILTNIVADKDVYAAFSSTLQQYTVTFMNGATTLGTVTVNYGADASDSSITTPTKEQTPQYTYTFVGWNSQDEQTTVETGVLNNITADKTVYAAFSSQIRTYTVSFYDYFGSRLLGTDIVEYGGNASDSEIIVPARSSTSQYDYPFAGWNSQKKQEVVEENVLNNITADKSVYPVYRQVLRNFTVYFYNGSELLYSDTVPYGSNATYSGVEPEKEAAGDYEYVFVGWNSQDGQSSAEADILTNIVKNKMVYAAFEQIDPTIYIYGIRREYGATDPAWTRTDCSADFTATATYGSTSGHSDFSDLPIYKDIKRVTLDTGDVMVQIPKFYFKRYLETDVTDGKEYECIKISRVAQPGFMIHPAFMHNNQEQDYIYVGAYLSCVVSGSSGSDPVKLYSQSGKTPYYLHASAHDYTKKTDYYRTCSNNKGSGWSEYDISAHAAIQMLYLVEYATNGSQSAVGKGACTGLSQPLTTGGCDNVANLTGGPENDDYTKQVVYRGIEDIWGNGNTFVDGVQLRNTRDIYVASNQSSYSSATNASGYNALSYSTFYCSTILKMGIDSENPAYMLPIETTDKPNYDTGYCDISTMPSETTKAYTDIYVGGYTNTKACGVFYYAHSTSNDSTSKPSLATSRLLYIPQSDTVKHVVTFYNGTSVLNTLSVLDGDNAVYSGEALTKASTDDYDYTFVGWNSQKDQTVAESGVLENITANKTVYAAFSQSVRMIMGTRAAGTCVYVQENVNGSLVYKPYIYLGKNENGHSILLREYSPNVSYMKFYGSGGTTGYNVSVVDSACSSYISNYPVAVQNALVDTTIMFYALNTLKTAQRKCFVLSAVEYGVTTDGERGTSYLNSLKTYRNTSDANAARITYSDAGSTIRHWTRTHNFSNYVNYISESNGAMDQTSDYYTFMAGIRPAIAVNPDTPITISNGNTYLAPTE